MTDFKIPDKAKAEAASVLFPGLHADEPITEFRGPFAFLSNFYPAEVEYEGVLYPTNEHAFQAAKTTDPDLRSWIRIASRNEKPDPGLAKQRGRSIELRPGWDEMKITVMEAVVLDKFVRNPELKAKLLATGDRELIEGNRHNDVFWGVSKGHGENWLGRILMRIRNHLS